MRSTATQQPESDADARKTKADPTQNAAVDYGSLNRRLGYVLRRAQIAVFRDFFAEFEAFGIRPGQYSILTVIESNPGLKQTVVSEALGIKRANFVAMINELEGRGLVRRDATPNDRRSNALVLTEAGERLITELHAAADRHERRFHTLLGPDALHGLFDGLGKLARMDDA
jgi:DNA-binding MarR family transcriptional regulator